MTAANIAPFIRGAHHLVYRPDGLVRPARMSERQEQTGEQIGRARECRESAGVTIDLVPTGDEVGFDLSVIEGLDDGKRVVTQTIDLARDAGDTREPAAGVVDGIDLLVDGVLVSTVEAASGEVTLGFDNPSHAPCEVRVCLPYGMAVAVGNLVTNGSIELPPERGYLLALGDSISQGYAVGSPSTSWPSVVARALGLDVVNQCIAGHVFDRHTLRGMRLLRENPPALITVAYGTNDWAHGDAASKLRKRASEYLRRVVERFPDVPVLVLGPLWRADEDEPRDHGKPLSWERSMIRDVCDELGGVAYVDGATVLPHDASLFADGRLHPNARGNALIATAMLEAVESSGLLERVGLRRHDTPVGRAEDQTLLRAGTPLLHPAFDEVVRTVWRLRQPDGCPWDREQTHASIAKNMIEEAYEALDAIERGDPAHLREELGDVLMQVLLHAQIAADLGEFTIDDVCRELNDKLVRRHPHVFGAHALAGTADEVLDIWSNVKLEERRERERSEQGRDAQEAPQGLLDSVPRSLPALLQAQKISKKAVACGFDWETTDDVWAKVDEERCELAREEPGSERALEEFGDVLFTTVNVARHEGLDAESALRLACDKFRRRWAYMEKLCRDSGDRIEDCSHDQLERLWGQAKGQEGAGRANLV